LHVSARIAQADACKAVLARVFGQKKPAESENERGAKNNKTEILPLKRLRGNTFIVIIL
jgi:hypothetical protein